MKNLSFRIRRVIFSYIIVCSWRLEPFDLGHYEWCDLLSKVPRTTQLRPKKTRREPYPIPSSPLLHGRFRSPHLPRLPAVHLPHSPRAHPTNVGRQEHDVRGWSSPRTLPNSLSHVQRKDEHKGSRRADLERPEQELILLRWVDPKQRQVQRLRHPADRYQNGVYLCRKLDFDPGDV